MTQSFQKIASIISISKDSHQDESRWMFKEIDFQRFRIELRRTPWVNILDEPGKKKQFRKHRCTDYAFLFTGGQANINALGLPLLPVRERTARALSKKAKCQWPTSLHLWSNRVSSIFSSSKNLFLLFDPKHFFNPFQSCFFLPFFLCLTNRTLHCTFRFLFLIFEGLQVVISYFLTYIIYITYGNEWIFLNVSSSCRIFYLVISFLFFQYVNL